MNPVQRMCDAVRPFVVAGSVIEFARNTLHALQTNAALGSERIYEPNEVVEIGIRHWQANRWIEVRDARELAQAMIRTWEVAR